MPRHLIPLELPYIHISISGLESPATLALVLDKIALVVVAVCPLVRAVTVHLVLVELADVLGL